jgi:hypothetical protein
MQILAPGPFFVGDSGYNLMPTLLIPYLEHEKGGGHLNPAKVHYEKQHSRTRITAEVALGFFKGRFRILKRALGIKSMQTASNTIDSCMVLHNVILLMDGEAETESIPAAEGESSCTVNDAPDLEDPVARAKAKAKANSQMNDSCHLLENKRLKNKFNCCPCCEGRQGYHS